MESSSAPLIHARGLVKRYEQGRVQALRGIDLRIEAGEFLAIMGPSGSGKSTLLSLLGALEAPDEGDVFFRGSPLGRHADLARFRCRHLGFVFQAFHLMPTLTARENVQVPMMAAGLVRSFRETRAKELLEGLGLADRISFRPNQLSGGERQRVAIARALANSPELLLADEPTGNLDSVAAENVLDTLTEVNAKHRTAVVVVTHDPSVARYANRVVEMSDGRIVDDDLPSASPAA